LSGAGAETITVVFALSLLPLALTTTRLTLGSGASSAVSHSTATRTLLALGRIVEASGPITRLRTLDATIFDKYASSLLGAVAAPGVGVVVTIGIWALASHVNTPLGTAALTLVVYRAPCTSISDSTATAISDAAARVIDRALAAGIGTSRIVLTVSRFTIFTLVIVPNATLLVRAIFTIVFLGARSYTGRIGSIAFGS